MREKKGGGGWERSYNSLCVVPRFLNQEWGFGLHIIMHCKRRFLLLFCSFGTKIRGVSDGGGGGWEIKRRRGNDGY